MSKQLESVLLKKTPCNGCRERKRKCSYEQPCTRCLKFNIECTYTVMPSPKDIEYIQELEYMKQIEFIQHQITCMEDEMGILKLAEENTKVVNSPSLVFPTLPPQPPKYHHNENANIYHYPSPVSMSSVHDLIIQKSRSKYRSGIDDHFHYDKPHYLRLINNRNQEAGEENFDAADVEKIKQEYCEIFLNRDGALSHSQTVVKLKNIEVALSKRQKKPWTLTLKNGNMSIETYITSHADLMAHMKGMLFTSFYQQKTSNLPFPLADTLLAPKDAIKSALSVLIWRKYGKSRFRSMTNYTNTLLHYSPANELAKVTPSENISNITMRLVYTHTKCLHHKFIYLHVPTVLRLFMKDEENVMKSSVIMALCSVICHQACKHLTQVVSNDTLTDYGLFYFEQARELIVDQFDEASLETLLTYTFMAFYKVKTKSDMEGDRYLCIAERIYNILLPQYQFKDGEPNSDEAILFARVYRCLYHVRSVIQLHDLMENMFKSRALGPHRLYELLDSQNNLDIYIAQDDSPKEINFIKMRRYLCQLREAIKEGAQCAAAADFPTYIGVFGHHIEMSMRHWYRHVLPREFQLSLPLFEDDIPDIEFFTTLELECNESPIPILTTLALYNEYLIMAKSYLPKNPTDTRWDTEDLLQKFKNKQNNIHISEEEGQEDRTHRWFKVIARMKHLRSKHTEQFTDAELEESDEQYITRFIQALNPSKLTFGMPFIHTSVRTALNMVRIIQFLLSRDYSCFLDLRWVMTAWEVLLRAAKFKYQQPGDEEVTLNRIRANLILCLNIIRDQITSSRRDASGTFVEVLEQDFNKSF